jgi:hypothetical protein
MRVHSYLLIKRAARPIVEVQQPVSQRGQPNVSNAEVQHTREELLYLLFNVLVHHLALVRKGFNNQVIFSRVLKKSTKFSIFLVLKYIQLHMLL